MQQLHIALPAEHSRSHTCDLGDGVECVPPTAFVDQTVTIVRLGKGGLITITDACYSGGHSCLLGAYSSSQLSPGLSVLSAWHLIAILVRHL